ncbi:bifunctional adenosylcobinamide kinase/adenosylcobinamide-phosphate guanylyltransferase [Virgibacillus sp. SK37]|uniref:bifunctional adenosylcobinamide kinase/adenosylcobinamide-phosphate guanylyltransferase n=1 Tax=Virgibacillus sp. SK37 TaxID=403957 RepID=UPI0004D18141|nr:bifunctional adenosylcobinamide kinase/adenosylcobinamide-phosphate guanylyltransferase [Virgibacillus sp. SK37]AIF45264.1 hypothetical protein X953_06220 [Virgibacillus sp. SK37]
MHFVTGGAYNGKRKWVKKHYPTASYWCSAYDGAKMEPPVEGEDHYVVVVEGVEHWVGALLEEETTLSAVREKMAKGVQAWLEWEKENDKRKLIIIGTDISKGIVPIEKHDRMWRDGVGWVYQDIAEQAEKMDVIWYGVAQQLK